MSENLTAISYLVSAIFFILALKGLSHPESARNGNIMGIIGMIIAVITTLFNPNVLSYEMIILGILIGGGIGTYIALKIEMTALPQLVAAFNSLVGLDAVFVATSAFYAPESYGIVGDNGKIFASSLVEMSIGVAIGAITFTGSIIAFLKLQGLVSGAPTTFIGQHFLNLLIFLSLVVLTVIFTVDTSTNTFWLIVGLSLLLGILLIIPIGGADMPVVVSMLNSYSGWAAAGIGFTLSNHLLIIVGSLVGASGAILSYIMCKGMNRSFVSVILGGFGVEEGTTVDKNQGKTVKTGSPEDAAFIMSNASSVIIVPGYGMAVAQAQHALREMCDILKKNGVTIKYAIHPVAGRMPGHMNVLLAEANVPYDEVFELEEINSEFSNTDAAFVIGANDITNPAAKTDKSSPIYGMPILDVENSGTVLFVKRSMASGYAGVDNELFFNEDTLLKFVTLIPKNIDKISNLKCFSFSNKEKKIIDLLINSKNEIKSYQSVKEVRAILYKLGIDNFVRLTRLYWAKDKKISNISQWRALLAMGHSWKAPKFPIEAKDILLLGVPEGPLVGEILNEVENWWIDSDFIEDKASLFERIKAIVGAKI